MLPALHYIVLTWRSADVADDDVADDDVADDVE